MNNLDGQKINKKNIGGETDNHGCIAATGETWSELKQSCVQIFNIGQRLNPIKTTGETVISAFVLFNDEESKVELFLPGNERETVVLDKSSEDLYANGMYRFDAKEKVLYVNGEKKYSAKN